MHFVMLIDNIRSCTFLASSLVCLFWSFFPLKERIEINFTNLKINLESMLSKKFCREKNKISLVTFIAIKPP
jgi:hypothetical protein